MVFILVLVIGLLHGYIVKIENLSWTTKVSNITERHCYLHMYRCIAGNAIFLRAADKKFAREVYLENTNMV